MINKKMINKKIKAYNAVWNECLQDQVDEIAAGMKKATNEVLLQAAMDELYRLIALDLDHIHAVINTLYPEAHTPVDLVVIALPKGLPHPLIFGSGAEAIARVRAYYQRPERDGDPTTLHLSGPVG